VNGDRSYEYKIVSRDGVAAKIIGQDRTIRLYRFGGGLDGVGELSSSKRRQLNKQSEPQQDQTIKTRREGRERRDTRPRGSSSVGLDRLTLGLQMQ
jgi:hypothetical protein